jgi:hypothetical protein
MPAKIHGGELPVKEIFSDHYCFAIPRYQRPYACTTEQAGELFDDLLGNLDGQSAIDQLDPYFLGSIVLIKEDKLPASQIVDGQQRLTTLTILLATLRPLVPPDYAKGITKHLYEEGNMLTGTPNRYRLTLRDFDADFFRTSIQEEKGIEQLGNVNLAALPSDSQRLIAGNALYFRKRLTGLNEQMRVRLAQFIIMNCFMVVVSTPDFDAEYRIFSVLNNRGLDLSLTDILKSDIIGKVPGAQQDAYGKKWEQIEQDLGRDSFQELFNHLRMIARKAKPKQSILKEVRAYVKPAEKPMEFIDKMLLPCSQAYDSIKTASFAAVKHADEINEYLRWLNRVDNVDWQPAAILYFTRHPNDPAALLSFLTALERLASGLMVTRADINVRSDRYGKLLGAIEAGEDLYRLNSPLQLTGAEKARVVEVINGNLYDFPRIRLHVLLYLDWTLSRASGASYNHPIISVEHVLPQTPAPGSQWLQWFGTSEKCAEWVHRLANLVLLSRRKNSEANNYDFETKKAKYFQSDKTGVATFALTTQVLGVKDWTPAVLEPRQANLVDKLKAAWRLA